jgi:HlyD family secretion protein
MGLVQRAEHNHVWRNAVVIGIVSLVAIATFWLIRQRTTRSEPTFRYEISVVDRGPLRAKVTATGTVNPIKTVQVGAQVSGRIQSLGADFNTVVKPGQMIAQIDPRLFEAAVNEASANLTAARANTRKARAAAIDARRVARRNRELASQQLIAQQTADTAEANAQSAEAAVDAARAAEVQAKAALETAELNLSYTKIISPVHGVVISRNIDVGQTVASSFSAPTLFLIGEDLTKMQVDTNIAEADVGRLSPGMVATFTVDAYPARTFRGTIREVRNSPQSVQNVVTYNAVIDVANPDLLLKPGMTANVEVIYADRTNVVRVANAALRFHPPPELVGKPPTPPLGHKLVWRERDDRLLPIMFKPGVSDGAWTEVLEGPLAPGDRVVAEAIGKPRARGRPM